jgi:hypothetical protein
VKLKKPRKISSVALKAKLFKQLCQINN